MCSQSESWNDVHQIKQDQIDNVVPMVLYTLKLANNEDVKVCCFLICNITITRDILLYMSFLLQHMWFEIHSIFFRYIESIYSFQDNFPSEILQANSSRLNDFTNAISHLVSLGKALHRASRSKEVLKPRLLLLVKGLEGNGCGLLGFAMGKKKPMTRGYPPVVGG